MENKKPIAKKVKHFQRSTTCDYCGFNQVWPDQRKRHLNGWAKIEIKQTITPIEVWKREKVHYHKMDMCPGCIEKRHINEI